MSIALPLRTVSLVDWDRDYAGREEGYELVDGVPIMTPTEAYQNNVASGRLFRRLVAASLPTGFEIVTHQAVAFGPSDRPTVRIPDLLVSDSTAFGSHRLDAADAHLVVEVVSDSGVETDWIHKRAEYAAAGIPTYVIVDVRSETPQIYAFTDPAPDETGTLRYRVPNTDGAAAVVTVAGVTIEIHAADLAP